VLTGLAFALPRPPPAYILGLAIYTGNQSKLACNKATPPSKMTRLERLINRLTVFIFIFQLAAVAAMGFGMQRAARRGRVTIARSVPRCDGCVLSSRSAHARCVV